MLSILELSKQDSIESRLKVKMQEFWDSLINSQKESYAVRKHLAMYQQDDHYYDLLSVSVVAVINYNTDRSFWDTTFGQTRTPEEIKALKFEVLKRHFNQYYQFFTKNSVEFPREASEIKQIATELFDLKADEVYLKNLTQRTKLGVVCVLYELWAKYLFVCSEAEFDAMLERIYKK